MWLLRELQTLWGLLNLEEDVMRQPIMLVRLALAANDARVCSFGGAEWASVGKGAWLRVWPEFRC